MLKRWAVYKRWYASGGSVVRDTPVGYYWTRRGAEGAMRDSWLGVQWVEDPYGRNALVLADLWEPEPDKQEIEVYRW